MEKLQPIIEHISALPPFITHNVSLKDKNWFRTGGNAEFFAEPSTGQEFQEALQFAKTHNLPITLIGEGANVLISDAGIAGLVIRPALKNITISPYDHEHMLLHAGAGVSMHDLIVYCLEHNLLGLEEFSGIPGSVGGSVYINLHYFEFLISQFLLSAQVIEKATGLMHEVDNGWFNFGYNYSTLHQNAHYLVLATFKLKKADALQTTYAQGRRIEIMRHRAKRYPTKNTCGSFFRNFHEHEVTLVSNNKKMIYVAYYLDKIGVKGQLRVGDALVSHQHANMIVNVGNATTADIIQLARTMQQMVFEQFGIVPQAECRLLGFDMHPLLS